MATSRSGATFASIKLIRDGATAIIELDRPDRLNAWDAQLADDVRAALDNAAADEGVRAIAIRGAGRAFSSGADLKAGFDTRPDGKLDVSTRLRERYHPAIRAIREVPKPVVAAVNGPAAGIGVSLALACDLVLAAESAYFLLAFVNIGLVPDGGSTLLVPARIGFARASELALLGERLPARRAVEWGLINRAVPDDRLDDELGELLAKLASGPTDAYAGVKRALNRCLYARMDEQLELEVELQQRAAESADFAEGVQAFLERRKPDFRGA